MIYHEVVSHPNFFASGRVDYIFKVANFIKKIYLSCQMAHMCNFQLFWGEELLDSGQLGRGKIQEILQEYILLAPTADTSAC